MKLRMTNDELRMKSGKPAMSKAMRLLPCALSLFVVALVTGCEDTPPNAYVPVPYVEAYLIVDRPIEGVTVLMSQPLSTAYDQRAALVRDADVTVTANGTTWPLAFRVEGEGGSYACPDTTVTVQPNTTYTLTVRLRDGSTLTGETTTPSRLAWIKPPAATLQYPSDTTKLPSPDSLHITWTPGNNKEYLIRVRCLDTLGYGRFLSPPTDEINGRTNNIDKFETPDEPTFYSVTRWGFVQTTDAPTVWTAFRWYGSNEVAVLAPDKHFLDWFKLTRFSRAPQFNREYSNITGGAGVVGSASVISGDVFLLKRLR
jgi:hypothetical protein